MRESKLCWSRSSPVILTFAAAAGMIATAVIAVRATPKAMKLLDEATEEKGEELTKIEMVKTAAPVYIPAAAVGICTLVCMFAANALNKKSQASLVSAYGLLNQSYQKYRRKSKELFGDEADARIRSEIAREQYQEKPVEVTNGKELFYEEFYGDFFELTREEVLSAEYHFNRNFILRGYATLNEFYEFLGLPPTKQGETLGWSIGAGEEFYGYSWVDFNHEKFQTDDGLTAITIVMPFPPTADYMDD